MKNLLRTFAVVAGLALAVPMLAQRGIAPSVTSGMHSGYPAASVTSGMHSNYPAASVLTPNNMQFGGPHGEHRFGSFQAPRMFNPQGDHREHRGDRDDHHFRDGFNSFYPVYYYDPYLYGYDTYVESNSSLPGAGTFNSQAQPEPANDAAYPQYRPYVESNSVVDSEGHIYDRRPENAPEAANVEAAQPAPSSSAQQEEPRTVLVFKDGRQLEVSNYAIMGSNLYLFAGDHRKISLTDLDLNATRKANDERGIEFHVPDAS